MIELTKVVKQLHHHIRLNNDFRSDLQWWAIFLPKWNGVGMMSTLSQRSDEFSLTTDASGSWGYGGLTIDYKWFQSRQKMGIAVEPGFPSPPISLKS